MVVNLNCEEVKDSLKIQLGSATSTDVPEITALMLDISYVFARPQDISFEAVFEKIDKAHTYIENAFEVPAQAWSQLKSSIEISHNVTELVSFLRKALAILREEDTFFVSSLDFRLQQLESAYVLRNETLVRYILSQTPALIQLLISTADTILLFFPDSQIFIDAITSCDDFTGKFENVEVTNLAVSIATSLFPGEAMKNLRAFYRNWWSKTSQDAKERISIGLELV